MRALILTGKLVQDHEFIYPYYRLLEEGMTVDVATKDGKETVGSIGTKIPANLDFDGMIKNEDKFWYDLLVLPGGAKCMEYLRQEKVALDFIRSFHEKGKPIASICHGAQLLISAGIVKGLSISGYYSIKDDIVNAGAEYVGEGVAISGNIISSPHYKHLGEWMKATIQFLKKND